MMQKIFAVALGTDYVELRACMVKPVKKRSRVVLEYMVPTRVETRYNETTHRFENVVLGEMKQQYTLGMATHEGGKVLACMHRRTFMEQYPDENRLLRANSTLLLEGAAVTRAKKHEREWNQL